MVSATTTATTTMTTAASSSVWGLSPDGLHERFWASRGVQVVRQGTGCELSDAAELYLLTAPDVLAIFRLAPLVDRFYWERTSLMLVRLHDGHRAGYREFIHLGEDGQFAGFKRVYPRSDTCFARVALTNNRAVAEAWQRATSIRGAWRAIRRLTSKSRRAAARVAASVYDQSERADVDRFLTQLVQKWTRPGATVARAREMAPGVWSDESWQAPEGVTFVGRVWVGAQCKLAAGETVVGPAVLPDDPSAERSADGVAWDEIEPELMRQADGAVTAGPPAHHGGAPGKRLFDVMFAIAVLVMTLPLYPLVMLAIWLEDGRPLFFAHRRETVGGREFGCIKFRSMRKDAEQVKRELVLMNRADGPQFFIEDDPRLTRVGRVLRRLNIDELPQFINVLLGHMSVVGPRPSPFKENQFCPAWREARLSVRPGVTGLWQVRRTRQPGLDFQEWIRYDISYVENVSWRLDLWIIWKTLRPSAPANEHAAMVTPGAVTGGRQ